MSEDTKRKLTSRQKHTAANIRHFWFAKKRHEKITQTEFSKQMGWSHSVFGQYLNGRVPCGPEAIFKIAEGLGCTPYDLDPEMKSTFAQPACVEDVAPSIDKMTTIEKQKLIRRLTRSLPQSALLETLVFVAEQANAA
jgi:transcriptional regulator with XRE-family HTH domain